MTRMDYIKTALQEMNDFDFEEARITLQTLLDTCGGEVMPLSPAMLARYQKASIYPGNGNILITLTLSAYLMLDCLIDAGHLDYYQKKDTPDPADFHSLKAKERKAALSNAPHWGIVQALEFLTGTSKILDPYSGSIEYAAMVFECKALAEIEAERRLYKIL